MDTWKTKLQRPFRKQSRAQSKKMKDASKESRKAVQALEPWPDIREQVEKEVLPGLNGMAQELNKKSTETRLDVEKNISAVHKRLDDLQTQQMKMQWRDLNVWFTRLEIAWLKCAIALMTIIIAIINIIRTIFAILVRIVFSFQFLLLCLMGIFTYTIYYFIEH